ncbi:YihY family inner membrane protein [Cellulomonas hominis]|nr:YihY family inner membrane protein [Cellulomonas hominis]
MTKRSWKYVVRTTVREFQHDQCTDLAAALTYYAVLALAPALLAIVSVLGLVGNGQDLVQQVVDTVQDVGPEDAAETIGPILDRIQQSPGAGLTFILSLALALWSASGYVAAFSRGMNRVYEIDEGRPIWKLRPVLLVVTVVLVLFAVAVVVALVASGGLARSIGSAIGLSDTAVTVWNIAKWPVVLVLVVLAVAILYYFTPNVRQPKFRWISPGAGVAVVVWVLASAAFGFYVANFGKYESTYGSLAGIIILLLWLWLLARECGLAVAERGGVVVGPTCRTSDPAVWAIGECASVDGECAGLIAPGNAMADVVVDQLCGGIRSYARTPDGTKLKGAGVDAASFGDVLGLTPGALEVTFADPVARTYRKLVVSDDARLLLGGVFVGDTDLYAQLRPLLGRPLGADPSAFLAQGGGPVVTDVPDDVVLCSCSNVTAGTVRAAVTEHGCRTVGEVKTCTRAGTVCGSCVPLLTKVVNTTLEQAGFEVSSAMCEHFAMSRAELFALVRTEGLRTFTEVVSRHGRGRGCAICRPVVASILASLGIGHVLSSDQAPLQDTNDHLLANLQKDGTYSVVPRMPGGEVTPEKLLAFAEVARDFGLFTRITGAQRIGMFGARQDQLPEIWRRLVDAGFESGHAYGKSLRQVKTCIGATWCRFGVQDSASMAVRLELRYRGLRAPHKFKMGVSGCARECAEARAKDVGVIATEKGWNVYVGGNGGFTPRHADLLAEDLDDARMIQVVDRFLALYVRRGDRLQRTAPFVAGFPGGIEELRRVVVEDSEGIGAELDAEIERHVASYADEWRTTLEDPEKLRRFTPYVNAPGVGDPDLAYVPERGQARPARPGEHGVPDLRTARALETQP